MKLVWRLFLLLALIALGWWLWSLLFPGPEKVIRKTIAEVARAASFVGNESPLASASHVSTLVSHFSVDAQVSLDVRGQGALAFNGRDEIRQAAVLTHTRFRALSVQFLDLAVTLAPDKLSATVDLTAKAKVPNERDFYVQEMKFLLKKINGDWLIVRVETVKTLSRVKNPLLGGVRGGFQMGANYLALSSSLG